MNNVDPNEIHKFSSMAPSWWDPNGPMKPLHALNPHRLHYINQHANIINQHVLDVGCGGGLLAEAMAKKGALVTGIDMSPDALATAQEHAAKEKVNVDYSLSTIEEHAEQHVARYDVITCLEMLEHTPDPGAIIKACEHCLKPGGRLFLSTINRNPKAFLFAIVGAEYVLNLLPKGTHEYAKLIKPAELNAFCEATELQLIDMVGIHYNPLTQHFYFNQKPDVNYMVCYEKPTQQKN